MGRGLDGPMIISASRRTDIPAFYTPWFMSRVRSGWCSVPNPVNPLQVSTVSLRPEDVEVIVFWTRNARPLLPHLEELEERGYRFYFLVTLMDNPRQIDTGCPPVEVASRRFQALANRVGPEKVIWRYDPIVPSSLTDPGFHKRVFADLAGRLEGYTRRCIISMMHPYRKVRKRFTEKGIEVTPWAEKSLGELLGFLTGEAHKRGMEIFSCASPANLERYGVLPGKCVDDAYIRELFGIEVTRRKDASQREACRCVASRDIGMYDTCRFGCLYCYATHSFARAHANALRHDPAGPSLVPLSRDGYP